MTITITITPEEARAIVWGAWAVQEDTVQRVIDAPESDAYTDEDIDYVIEQGNALDRAAIKAQRALDEEETS